MVKERNWSELQAYYDLGNSWAEVTRKFKVYNKTLQKAIQDGFLKTRTRTETLIMGLEKQNRRNGEHRWCIACDVMLVNKQRKFCSIECRVSHEWNTKTLPRIEGGTGGISVVKKYLLGQAKLCSECFQSDTWNSKPLSLHLDHINGNSDDNRLENVRLLCPNCHSQTENFGIKNKGQDSRRNRHMKRHRDMGR